jgi:hypothetical protein
MNIALATLVLVIILYPGFIFRRFYYTAEFSKQYFKQQIVDLVFAAILPAFILHVFANLVLYLTPYRLSIPTVGTLLSGSSDAVAITAAFDNIFTYLGPIMLYFSLISVAAMLAGVLFRTWVRKKKWDRKFTFFRFQNEWHYLFSGEILDFPNVPGDASHIDFIYVDLMMESKEGTVIYMGILSHYVLDNSGGIDRLYLSEVKRRYLKDDPSHSNTPPYYQMPGDFTVIPYRQVLNMHLTNI